MAQAVSPVPYFLWYVNNRLLKKWTLPDIHTYIEVSTLNKTEILHNLVVICFPNKQLPHPIPPPSNFEKFKEYLIERGGEAKTIRNIILAPDQYQPVPEDILFPPEPVVHDAVQTDSMTNPTDKFDINNPVGTVGNFINDLTPVVEHYKNPLQMTLLRMRGGGGTGQIDDYDDARDCDAAYDKAAAAAAKFGRPAIQAIDSIEEQIDRIKAPNIKKVYKIARDIWFLYKSLCCALHDKAHGLVAIAIRTRWLKWLLEYYKDSTPRDFVEHITGLISRLNSEFDLAFGLHESSTGSITGGIVTQARCHKGGEKMFAEFKIFIEGLFKKTGIKIVFSEKTTLYRQPYSVYKDQWNDALNGLFFDGSIGKLMMMVERSIFDATTLRLLKGKSAVYDKLSWASIDGAQQANDIHMNTILIPYVEYNSGKLRQHLSICIKKPDTQYVWYHSIIIGRGEYRNGIPIPKFGPIAVIVHNVNFTADNHTMQDSIQKLHTSSGFASSSKQQKLLDSSPTSNFYMPLSLLLRLYGKDKPLMDNHIRILETKLSEYGIPVRATIDDTEMVAFASVLGNVSQNVTVNIAKGLVEGIEHTSRGRGCANSSATIFTILDDLLNDFKRNSHKMTPTHIEILKQIILIISVLLKEWGDCSKEHEQAMLNLLFKLIDLTQTSLSTGDLMAGMDTSNRGVIIVECGWVEVVAPKGLIGMNPQTLEEIRVLQQAINTFNNIKPQEEAIKAAYNLLKERISTRWNPHIESLFAIMKKLSNDTTGTARLRDQLLFTACIGGVSKLVANSDETMWEIDFSQFITPFDKFRVLASTAFNTDNPVWAGVWDVGGFMECILIEPHVIQEMGVEFDNVEFLVNNESKHTSGGTVKHNNLVDIVTRLDGDSNTHLEHAPLFWLCEQIQTKIFEDDINDLNMLKKSVGKIRGSDRTSSYFTRSDVVKRIQPIFIKKLKAFLVNYCNTTWGALYLKKGSKFYETLKNCLVIEPQVLNTFDQAFNELPSGLDTPNPNSIKEQQNESYADTQLFSQEINIEPCEKKETDGDGDGDGDGDDGDGDGYSDGDSDGDDLSSKPPSKSGRRHHPQSTQPGIDDAEAVPVMKWDDFDTNPNKRRSSGEPAPEPAPVPAPVPALGVRFLQSVRSGATSLRASARDSAINASRAISDIFKRRGGSRNNTKRIRKFKRTPNKRNKTIRNKINTKYSLRNTIKRRKTRRSNRN